MRDWVRAVSVRSGSNEERNVGESLILRCQLKQLDSNGMTFEGGETMTVRLLEVEEEERATLRVMQLCLCIGLKRSR